MTTETTKRVVFVMSEVSVSATLRWLSGIVTQLLKRTNLRGAESILDRLKLTLAHRLPDLEELPRDTFCVWRSRQRPKPMVISALEFPCQLGVEVQCWSGIGMRAFIPGNTDQKLSRGRLRSPSS